MVLSNLVHSQTSVTNMYVCEWPDGSYIVPGYLEGFVTIEDESDLWFKVSEVLPS